MNAYKLLGLAFVSCILPVGAQTLSSVVLDSASQKPIPYANIMLGNKGAVTNEEGRFSITLSDHVLPTDSLVISCMGYRSIAKPIDQFTEKAIYLPPNPIELKGVIVSNKNYTAEEIMDFVKDNLDKNHGDHLTKKRIFHRQSYYDDWTKSDFKVKKSTIDVFDQRFLDSIIKEIPKNDAYYSEILGDLHGNHDPETQKLTLLKASKLYDKNTELDSEKLKEHFMGILKENIKEGSYFKVKSGILSFKIDKDEVSQLFEEEIDSTDAAALKAEMEKAKKDKEDEKKNYVSWKRNKLGRIMGQLPTADGTDLDFIRKTRKYEYTLKEFTYLGDAAVYVIDFRSKGSADYKGTLYINADDFALLQANYWNVKPLKKFSLLGVSYNDYLAKGKVMYAKAPNGRYGLRYFQSETASRAGVRRPLKIIEKNKIVKGRNKQNELSGKMDFSFVKKQKNEVVVFETEPISNADFDQITEENNVLPIYMAQYDPDFWKGHTIMEPNTAIKEFTATETE